MSDALNQRDIDSLIRRTASGGKVTSDSLTQREIDAILQKNTPVPLAPVVSDEIIPYNFSRPPRVSKDRRASLESIYNRFALSMQGLLSSMLRSPVDVVVNSVEQAMFSEFILSLGTPCASFIFSIGNRLGGEGAMDLSTDFAFHLVDRLFGGPGDTAPMGRPLTPLEQGVVRNVADRSLVLLKEAWVDHLAMSPQVVAFEANPDMLQITSREDNVLVTSLEIRSQSFTGFITLCLPMAAMETFLQEKSNGRGSSSRTVNPDAAANRVMVQSSLQHASVEVAARFPTLWLDARTLTEMVPGRVLHSGQTTDGALELHVNDRLRYVGSLGQVRQHLGIRITESVNKPVADRPVKTRQGRLM